MEWINLGFLGLFIVSFLSATIIPFSSDAIVGIMIGMHYNAFFVWIIASIGNTLGGMTNYYIGKAGKTEWFSKYLKISEKRIEKATKLTEKYSNFAAFFSWLPGIGDALALVLGLLKANQYKVFLFMFIGKSLRYAVIIVAVKYGISLF
jgi:membrane protein YqaA with SNARE-associated domain